MKFVSVTLPFTITPLAREAAGRPTAALVQDRVEVAALMSQSTELGTPQRSSQVVRESSPVLSTGKKHLVIKMERRSTSGRKYEAHFKRASTGPMTGAERAAKKRVRATLFKPRQLAPQQKDAQRKAAEREQKRLMAALACEAKDEAGALPTWWDEPPVDLLKGVKEYYLDCASWADELGDGELAGQYRLNTGRWPHRSLVIEVS